MRSEVKYQSSCVCVQDMYVCVCFLTSLNSGTSAESRGVTQIRVATASAILSSQYLHRNNCLLVSTPDSQASGYMDATGLRLHGCCPASGRACWDTTMRGAVAFSLKRLTSFARACPFLRGAGHSRAQPLPSPPQSSPHELCAQPEGGHVIKYDVIENGNH